MKLAPTATLLALTLLAPLRLYAQISSLADLPSAAPAQTPGKDSDERGRKLLDQMVEALGGEAWLNRTFMQLDGRTAIFFQGRPDLGVNEYHELRRLPASGKPEASRIGFLTDRGMIVPGKKIDVFQIWTNNQGYEITYKGETTLPKEQVEDFYRRRSHSIESVIHDWIKKPGVMVLAEGTAMVERHLADKVTILSDDNDAVTIEIDAATHLPLRRIFEWRNPQFKDHDEDAEEYDDYHTYDGIPTPMTVTRYKNGEMVNQRYYTKITYNISAPDDMFDPTVLPKINGAKKK